MKLYLLDQKGIPGYLEKKQEIPTLKLCTLLSRDLLNENAKKYISGMIKAYKHLGLTNSNMVFAFNNDFNKVVFTNEELKTLKELTDYFQKNHVKVGVYNEGGFYAYDQVKTTCETIKKEAGELLSHKYSPMEKLMHAYCKVAERQYISEKRAKEYEGQSRSVFGVLTSDKIVCKGYANYLQALLTEMNDENIKCFANDFGMLSGMRGPKDKMDVSAHATDIVYLKDEKYGINGFFHVDPTWDFKRGNKIKTSTLAYFLLNLADINAVYPDGIRDIYFTEAFADKVDKNDPPPNPKWPNTCFNFEWPRPCSLTLDGTNLKIQKQVDKAHQDGLGDYLLKRQDFRDFLVLEQTARDCKNNKGDFDTCFQKNYELAQNDITKFNVLTSKRTVNKYMVDHSSKVDMKEIMDALSVVLKNFDADKTKDERSRHMYDMLRKSISYSKKVFSKKATSDFAKSEM